MENNDFENNNPDHDPDDQDDSDSSESDEDFVIKINKCIKNNDFAEYERILSVESGVKIYGILGYKFGKISKDYYQIAVKLRIISKHLEYASSDENEEHTSQLIHTMFYYMCDHHSSTYEDDEKEYVKTPQAEYEKNIMETINVLYNHFGQLSSYSHISIYRSQYRNDPEYEYSDNNPTFFCENLLSLVMDDSDCNHSKTFGWEVLLKLIDLGVDIPDHVTSYNYELTRPLQPEDGDNETKYIRIITSINFTQQLIEYGALHALKGLYDRFPDRVKQEMTNTEYHVGKFRKQIDGWKGEEEYDSDDDTGDILFNLYHSNADQILADMDEFIVFVQTH